MRKNTTKNKKQIRSGSKKEAKEDFSFYIGIDLGDKTSDVCVLDQSGEVSKEFRLRMKEADFRVYFASIPRSRVAIEAGGQSRWVAEVAEKWGHEVYVSNTRKVPYIHQSDDKDDPGDACKLAELLYFKPRLLHPVQHRSREAQADLSWIRAREVLVESRTQLINAVRGISKAFAGRLERCATEAFTAKLAGQVPEAIRGAVAPLLETIDHLNDQI
jgi:transposase